MTLARIDVGVVVSCGMEPGKTTGSGESQLRGGFVGGGDGGGVVAGCDLATGPSPHPQENPPLRVGELT